jgi:hypothetical protein
MCPVLGDRDVTDVELVVEVSGDAVMQHSADAEEVEEELGGDAGVELSWVKKPNPHPPDLFNRIPKT